MEIRRSSRNCEKIDRQKQTNLAAHAVKNEEDPSGFDVQFINSIIGYGVFTTKSFEKGQFLLRYPGPLISWAEGVKREKEYDARVGSFLYFFKCKGKYYCVDATNISMNENKGRMVNDAPISHSACNSEMRIVGVYGSPHLCIFARRSIQKGEELRYDYGVDSLEWRKKKTPVKRKQDCQNGDEDRKPTQKKHRHKENCQDHGIGSTLTQNSRTKRKDDTVSDIRQETEADNTDTLDMIDTKDETNYTVSDSMKQSTLCQETEAGNTGTLAMIDDEDETGETVSYSRQEPVEDNTDTLIMSDKEDETGDTVSDMRQETDADDTDTLDMIDNEAETGETVIYSRQETEADNTDTLIMNDKEDETDDEQVDEHNEDDDNDSDYEVNSSELDDVDSSDIEFRDLDDSDDINDKPFGSKTVMNERIISENEALPSEWDIPESAEDEVFDSQNSHASNGSAPSSKPIMRNSTVKSTASFSDENASQIPDYRILDDDQKVFCTKHHGIFIKKIDTSSKSKSGRSYDTVHACFVCGKLMTNIQKHIENAHRNVDIVKNIRKLKNDADMLTEHEAKKHIEKSIANKQCLIRNEGDDGHNLKVMKTKRGELLVSRRRKGEFNSELYGACPECREWIVLRDNYNQHRKHCPANSKITMTEAVMQNLIFQGRIIATASPEIRREVFPIMHADEITTTAITDRLIVALGEIHFMSSIGNRLKRKNYASYRMRLAGRLLNLVRKEIGKHEATMAECLQVEFFDTFAKCAVLACGKNNDSEMQHPSVALKLGFDIAKLTAAKIGFSAKNRDDKAYKEAKMFQKLLKTEWKLKVRKQATFLLEERKFNKSNELPDPADVAKLAKYLVDQLSQYDCRETVSTSDEYRRLAILTEARLLLYNRRRPGELEALTIETYRRRSIEVNETDLSLRNELTTLEKKLLDTQQLLELRGKGNKKVPVLLPLEVQQPLDILTDMTIRQGCGIDTSNKYVFATTGMEPLRAGTSLDIVKFEAGLRFPLRILATNLRKHTATISQVMGLKDNELRWLVNHMGHTEKVHIQHYRATSGLIERLDVAKIMLMQEQNLVGKFAGVELQNINFEDIEEAIPSSTMVSAAAEIATHSETESLSGDEFDESDIHVVPQKKAKAVSRVPWTEGEIKEISNFFKDYIDLKSTRPCPRMKEILQACAKSRAKGGLLWKRHWETIKKKVSYLVQKSRKK